MSTAYLVVKETTTLQWCTTCRGSGKKTRTFQGRKFNDNCIMCKGTGKQEVKKTTHVPLKQALTEIKKDMTTQQLANEIIQELNEAGFDYNGMVRVLELARKKYEEMKKRREK